ncbi:MAG TPA: TrkA family potassium uptake protein [Roseiflexaceae bacterium]|nr:TrkA family potassium uptake protein [Roseiflexaceae bacterium]
MYLIIVGCGRVGSYLAHVMDAEGHEVVIVDKDPLAFKRISREYGGQKIVGIGFDRDVLRSAGIERADAFAAVTNGDNSNYIAASVARDTFRVPQVVARIYDPQREAIYRELGIRTISSTSWAVNTIKRILTSSESISTIQFGSGEVEIVEVEVSGRLVGRYTRDLAVPGEIMPISIVRRGRAFLPTPGVPLESGDVVHVAVLASASGLLESMIR